MANEIKLQLPDDIIQSHIRLAVANALGAGDPQTFIQAVVDVAIKKKDRYGQKTIWEETVEKMIVEAANQIVKEFFQQEKDAIRAALLAALKAQRRKVVDALIDGLFRNAGAYRDIKVHFEVHTP